MTAVPAEAESQLHLQGLARAYFDGARLRERSARHLAQRRDWVAALRIYSEATELLLRAHLAAGGDQRQLHELLPGPLLDALLELARRQRWAVPAELERLRGLLSRSEWDALDRMDELEAERASDDFATAVRFLVYRFPEVQHAERRSELRWFAAGAGLLALSALGVLLWSLTRPLNLALQRPVSATPAGFATQSQEAVNGARFGEIGYHSQSDAAWLQIDLEAERSVRRVEIYGRGDCCFDQSLPLIIEGSSDGAAYHALGRLSDPFRPFRPSVLTLEPTNLRYLRLRTPKRVYLMVAEVEVY